MNREDFETGYKIIKDEFHRKLDALYREYANANNPCKIGDIIETNIGFGRVLAFSPVRPYAYACKTPMMIYKVKRLTKKLEPCKRGSEFDNYYQLSIKSINGVPVK